MKKRAHIVVSALLVMTALSTGSQAAAGLCFGQRAAGNAATALDRRIRRQKRGLQATGKRRYGICRRAHRSTGGRRGACGAHHMGTANRGAG